MKALYVEMMDLYLIFQFFKARCHANQIILRKCYQRRLIPLAFVALVLENELQYYYYYNHCYYYMNLVTLHKSLEKKRIVGAETVTLSVCESQFVKMFLRHRSESFICLSET